jgi:acetyl esterase/lipase
MIRIFFTTGFVVTALILMISCNSNRTTEAGMIQVDTVVTISPTTVYSDVLPQSFSTLKGVTVTTDLVYSTPVGFRPLRLDLYSVTNDTTVRPLVLFVHGGSWTKGNKRTTSNYADWPGVMAMLARKGYLVASIEYRLSGEARFPGSVLDVKAAIRFLRANSKQFFIDETRIGVWGGSAGAHLAAMAAFASNDSNFKQSDALSETPDDVAAYVGWYGPYDIQEMLNAMASAPPNENASPNEDIEYAMTYFGCTTKGCSPEIIAQGSPILFVDANDPPALLIHGTKDSLVPHSQTERMANKIRAVGGQVETSYIDGVGHGWVSDNFNTMEDASRKALKSTFDFFDKHLKK